MVHIKLKNVNVDFPGQSFGNQYLTSQMAHFVRNGLNNVNQSKAKTTANVLQDISLSVNDGDRIGLIGRNGSGKTTLLRVLAGIFHPTGGAMDIKGNVSTLLSGSLGVDEDLTGYEVIDYGCLLFGLKRREIRKIRSEIADFTELGHYLNMPVRTYSTGMKLRLSFGVATCYAPEILLVDEVIGAGDALFIEKAKKRVVEFMSQSSILLLASHSDDIIKTICNKAILLEEGRILIAGDVSDVLNYYYEAVVNFAPLTPVTTETGKALSGGDRALYDCANVFDGDPKSVWRSVQRDDQVKQNAYIGYDFGPDNIYEVNGFTVRQWNGAESTNMVDSVVVQTSNVNFDNDINTIEEIAIEKYIRRHNYKISKSMPARYWRLLANSNTEGGEWGIAELVFWQGDTPPTS